MIGVKINSSSPISSKITSNSAARIKTSANSIAVESKIIPSGAALVQAYDATKTTVYLKNIIVEDNDMIIFNGGNSTDVIGDIDGTT